MGTMATAAILNVINTPKASKIFRRCFMKFDERNEQFLKIPSFFISMATAAKFVLPIPICLAYIVPLDVDVT